MLLAFVCNKLTLEIYKINSSDLFFQHSIIYLLPIAFIATDIFKILGIGGK